MKYATKKIYLIFLLIVMLLTDTVAFSKNTEFEFSKDDISNYFSGIVLISQNNTTAGFKYLNKVQSLKNIHSNFNVQFIRSLVLLEKFDEAFAFSKSIWNEEDFFFEADLLLGLESFIKKDYLNAERHFMRINKISKYNLLFDDFLGNVLISWVRALTSNKEDAFKFIDKIPNHYENLKKIQNVFLHCYFDSNSTQTESAFGQLIENEEFSSRYSFFLANYLIQKDKYAAAEKIIKNGRKKYNSNLLIKQSENFMFNKNTEKIKNLFNCKFPKDPMAEIFYVISNLYSSNKDFQLSNFYLKISLFLNEKFKPNMVLLAENFFNQKKYELSKKTYNSIRSVGSVYSWRASINSANILENTAGKEKAISTLIKEFNALSNANFEHFYDMANFFKNNDYYRESIKYYSLALGNIEQNHFLVPKILDRRGTSYERLGEWDKAEKDLLKSLSISPEQPYVLNYLAYSWIEKEKNIKQSIEMLKKANKLRKNDGYIIDSLGWAYYLGKNYTDAEKYLQRAVEILPLDPIINDHYADALWMLKKDIQARYFWKHVLSLNTIEQELKDKVNKKIIFGINKEL